MAQKLKQKNVSVLYTSPFIRTKETADIIAKELSLSSDKVIEDNRIREYDFGDFSDKPFEEYLKYEAEHMWQYDSVIPNGESYLDAKIRFGEFLYDIDANHNGETIAVVTHGIGLEVLAAVVEGADSIRSKEIIDTLAPENASFYEFSFTPFPHNQHYELDLHRPYIDEVVLHRDGKEYRRVKEVLDVWFDSGAMPFAQHHYPFSEATQLPFPADYISEAIDQTRGWFYTLHAIGVLTGRGHAYNNVICLGHLLDKDGKKMSKSIGNVINPWEMIEQFGVDPLRFWMYTINQPGESKNFDPKTVDEVVKKVFNLVLNVAKFYEPYVSERKVSDAVSPNVLDQWILSLLDDVVFRMTNYLDDFKILEAARLIRDFIGDLSQWYLRRSRDRFKGDNVDDKQNAINTLGFVLERLSIVMAPFMPFLAEDLYEKLKTNQSLESVHLEVWPDVHVKSAGQILCLTQMDHIRTLVTLGLEARAKVGIKVRQPLALLTVKDGTLRGADDYLQVLMDEVNVKAISFDEALESEVVLNSEISEELKREGEVRELMRTIQDMRKEKNLSPSDVIQIHLSLTAWGKLVMEEWEVDLKKTCSINEIVYLDLPEDSPSWFSVSF